MFLGGLLASSNRHSVSAVASQKTRILPCVNSFLKLYSTFMIMKVTYVYCKKFGKNRKV